MTRGGGRASRAAERVYRMLLVAYPKEFREEYGPQMVQAFGDLCQAELRSGGLGGLIWLCAWTLWDLAINALAERSRRGRAALTSPGLVGWCGIAAVLGGLLKIFGLSPYTFQALRLRDAFSDPVLQAISQLQSTLISLLTAAGLVGLYALLGRRRSRLARAGAVLVCVFAVVAGGLYLYGWAVSPPPLELVEEPLPILIGMAVGMYGRLLGLLLLVVVALRSRKLLGQWGIVLLVLFVLHTPLLEMLVLGSSGHGGRPGPLGLSTPMLLMILHGAVWITLGCMLWFSGARGGSGGGREEPGALLEEPMG